MHVYSPVAVTLQPEAAASAPRAKTPRSVARWSETEISGARKSTVCSRDEVSALTSEARPQPSRALARAGPAADSASSAPRGPPTRAWPVPEGRPALRVDGVLSRTAMSNWEAWPEPRWRTSSRHSVTPRRWFAAMISEMSRSAAANSRLARRQIRSGGGRSAGLRAARARR